MREPARGQARAALDQAREAQKLADTWLGRVVLARTYEEATSELDVAIKRQGEATALMLDEEPTVRWFPAVHYHKGLAQAGLKSPAAKNELRGVSALARTAAAALSR